MSLRRRPGQILLRAGICTKDDLLDSTVECNLGRIVIIMGKRSFITCLCIGGIILFSLVIACFTKFEYSGSLYNDKQEAMTGWYYLDEKGNLTDKEADLGLLEYDDSRHARVGRVLTSDGLKGGDLCFISTNVSFEAYLNDEKLYDFNPEIRFYTGRSYGNVIHEITAPFFEGTAFMRLEVDELADGMWAGFQRAYFQGTADYLKEMLSENLYKLILSIICFIIGLMLVIFSLIFEFRSKNRLESVAVGVVAMILAFWTNSGTFMLEMLIPDKGIIRMLNYFALIFLPVPGLLIVCCVTKSLGSRLMRVTELLAAINCVVTIIAVWFLSYDYHDVLLFTHFNFLLAVLFAVHLIGYAYVHHAVKEKSQSVVLFTFMFLVMTGVLDLILYYTSNSTDMARFSRVGLLIFIVVLSTYELGQLIELGQKVYESDLMKKLAHEDGLTKLENRLAFTEYERELTMRNEGFCVIVQFDINFLKKVNDNYGHSEGDRIIMGGAEVIRNSFAEYGRVFRTGGDEFISVIVGKSSEQVVKVYNNCEKRLKKCIEEFNEREKLPVPLVLAYGMAEYDCSSGNPEEQERLADERMYAHKKALKAETALAQLNLTI